MQSTELSEGSVFFAAELFVKNLTMMRHRARCSGVMHANAIRTLLHDMGYKQITRHGFRSSFRDWAGECTHYPREVCEMALAHDERD